eukprot:TRINITY_DN12838_c0_g2_i2.p1 TRINITY_DN12838_c0_g2~~TRINITY_DN12838_c0_g2_i2.p1  ORF type:complete len:203 (+),score=-19.63 TRINITY_DN12838_c0_g2_i2:373-981(+)
MNTYFCKDLYFYLIVTLFTNAFKITICVFNYHFLQPKFLHYKIIKNQLRIQYFKKYICQAQFQNCMYIYQIYYVIMYLNYKFILMKIFFFPHLIFNMTSFSSSLTNNQNNKIFEFLLFDLRIQYFQTEKQQNYYLKQKIILSYKKLKLQYQYVNILTLIGAQKSTPQTNPSSPIKLHKLIYSNHKSVQIQFFQNTKKKQIKF